jgi:hypothetical protein
LRLLIYVSLNGTPVTILYKEYCVSTLKHFDIMFFNTKDDSYISIRFKLLIKSCVIINDIKNIYYCRVVRESIDYKNTFVIFHLSYN